VALAYLFISLSVGAQAALLSFSFGRCPSRLLRDFSTWAVTDLFAALDRAGRRAACRTRCSDVGIVGAMVLQETAQSRAGHFALDNGGGNCDMWISLD
jgi:hypothetical protein